MTIGEGWNLDCTVKFNPILPAHRHRHRPPYEIEKVCQDSPTVSRVFSISGRISAELFDYFSDLCQRNGQDDPQDLLKVCGVPEFLKVFLPLPDNIPSQGQKLKCIFKHKKRATFGSVCLIGRDHCLSRSAMVAATCSCHLSSVLHPVLLLILWL